MKRKASKPITEAMLMRAHVAQLSGVPLKHVAEAMGLNYTELSRKLKAWRRWI